MWQRTAYEYIEFGQQKRAKHTQSTQIQTLNKREKKTRRIKRATNILSVIRVRFCVCFPASRIFGLFAHVLHLCLSRERARVRHFPALLLRLRIIQHKCINRIRCVHTCLYIFFSLLFSSLHFRALFFSLVAFLHLVSV